jgi:hypothetical protein
MDITSIADVYIPWFDFSQDSDATGHRVNVHLSQLKHQKIVTSTVQLVF